MNKITKKICFSSMFAAMIFGMTMLHIPIGAGGYIHAGDAVIYMGALLIGGPWAFIAAGIGAAAADIVSGFAGYAIPSLIIKVLIAVPFVLVNNKSSRLLTPLTAVLLIPSSCITVCGYYFADLVFYKDGAIADIPANVVQAAGSAVVFVLISLAFDRADIKKRFKKEF